MKTAGIVGGIGPESTIEYYRGIVRLYRERNPDGSYPPNTLVVVAGLVEPGVLVEVQTILGE